MIFRLIQEINPRECTADDCRYILIAFAIIVLRMPALIIDVILIRNRNAYKTTAIAAFNWISVSILLFYK